MLFSVTSIVPPLYDIVGGLSLMSSTYTITVADSVVPLAAVHSMSKVYSGAVSWSTVPVRTTRPVGAKDSGEILFPEVIATIWPPSRSLQ